MNKITKGIIAGVTILAASVGLSACGSDADKVSRNVSTAAENFEVQRLIVGVNAISDKPAFSVEKLDMVSKL